MLAAFTFPPIDELFRWKDIVFKGSPFAINKTALLILISTGLIIAIFVGGSRKMKLVPSGLQNVLEMTHEFVPGLGREIGGYQHRCSSREAGDIERLHVRSLPSSGFGPPMDNGREVCAALQGISDTYSLQAYTVDPAGQIASCEPPAPVAHRPADCHRPVQQ